MTGRNRRPILTLRRPSALARCLSLVALVAFALLSMIGPSVALCVGDDGHVSFEPIDAACCSGDAGVPRGEPSQKSMRWSVPDDPAGCGDCVDATLRVDVREQTPRVPLAKAPAAAIVPGFHVGLIAPYALRVDPSSSRPGTTDATRLALRTVVLRV